VAPTESAVVVPVPEAEGVVGEHRARLDRAAVRGVPAHVTVLHPFVPPDQLHADHLRTLAAAVRSVPRFDVVFADVRWFGEDVVWVAPEPDSGFRALIDAVTGAFPAFPPYGGVFDDPVPHLTIGAHATHDALSAAASQVAARLPFRASIDVVHLLQGSDAPGAWHRIGELPLG
jgi:LmbE family N-acetylglucosaminyl deacetylase